MSLTIKADLSGLDQMLDQLATDIEDAARPAAQAAAQVLYDEVKRNVGRLGTKTGKLAQAIYQAYSKDNSGQGRATYHVSWNVKKAPHGHLVEFGHVQKFRVFLGKDGKWHTDKRSLLVAPRQVAARPFIRPAVAKFPEASAAAEAVLLRRINNL